MSSATRSTWTPLSPSSPPDSGLKRRLKSHEANSPPRLPLSPPLMSVATKSYVSSYPNNQHSDEMAQKPSPSSPTYNQRMNTSYTAREGSLKRPSPSVDEDGHRDKRQRTEGNEGRMDVDPPVAPTRYMSSFHGDVRSSSAVKPPSQSSETAAQALEDSGETFLICQEPIPRTSIDPEQHLLGMYGLGDLLRSVARFDPITGEKINKLRKSYEGQIKNFSLLGKNKPVKSDRESHEPGLFVSRALIPDSQWDGDQGMTNVTFDDSLKEMLTSAMQLQPGTVRNNAMWEDALGHNSARPLTPISRPSGVPNGLSRPQVAPVSGDKRSTRGKKRSYDDDSFAGYGEGYSDGDDGGIDDDEEHQRRKRKKV